MRLEQVFALDTRQAMAQIQRQFGEDSMVVSNRRYNGRNELIAAVENQPRKAPDVAVMTTNHNACAGLAGYRTTKSTDVGRFDQG